MDTTNVAELFGDRDICTGNTIFHKLAEDGALLQLYYIRDKIDRPLNAVLQIKNYNGEFSIHTAAQRHRGFLAIKLIEVLVGMGADLNAKDGRSGNTVLHTTVCCEDYELAEWLCKQSTIDLNAKNYAQLTAYQLAFKRKNEQLMGILRTSGAVCETPEDSDDEWA